MASIEVDYPLHGTHVPTTFTAEGTFAGGTIADISCSLMRGSVTVASGTVSSPSSGRWEAHFAGPLSPESYLTLAAHITGSSPDLDEEDKITIDSALPLALDDLPTVRLSSTTTTPTRITITGRHRSHITSIACVAFIYFRRKVEGVAAVAVGGLDTPSPGLWKATLSYAPLSSGRKLGVMAVGFDLNGIVRGRSFRRRR